MDQKGMSENALFYPTPRWVSVRVVGASSVSLRRAGDQRIKPEMVRVEKPLHTNEDGHLGLCTSGVREGS